MSKDTVYKKLEKVFEGLSEEEILALPLHKYAQFFLEESFSVSENLRDRINLLESNNQRLLAFLEAVQGFCNCGSPIPNQHNDQCIAAQAHITKESLKSSGSI